MFLFTFFKQPPYLRSSTMAGFTQTTMILLSLAPSIRSFRSKVFKYFEIFCHRRYIYTTHSGTSKPKILYTTKPRLRMSDDMEDVYGTKCTKNVVDGWSAIFLVGYCFYKTTNSDHLVQFFIYGRHEGYQTFISSCFNV